MSDEKNNIINFSDIIMSRLKQDMLLVKKPFHLNDMVPHKLSKGHSPDCELCKAFLNRVLPAVYDYDRRLKEMEQRYNRLLQLMQQRLKDDTR